MRKPAAIAVWLVVTAASVAATVAGLRSYELTVRWSFFLVYACVVAVALIAALLVVSIRSRTGRRVPFHHWELLPLLVATFPLATLVLSAFVPLAGTFAAAIPSVLGVWAVTFVLFAVLAHRTSYLRSMGLLLLATSAVVVADQLVGGTLAVSSILGYDRSSGMRLYGLGNELASLMVSGLIVGWAAYTDSRPPHLRHGARGLMVAGAIAIAVAVAPVFGANIGVLAWGGVALVVTVMELAGRKVTWREVGIALGVIVVLGLGFAFVDSRSAFPTHIGETWLKIAAGDWSALSALFASRASTSWRVLTYSPVALAAIAAIGLVVKLRLMPGRIAGPLLERQPALRAALDGALWSTPVALVVEDSGIVVPALVMLFVACALLTAALEKPVPAEEAPA